ncbi:hypothetical protein L345_14447, partial [Ophiophagus hannah]
MIGHYPAHIKWSRNGTGSFQEQSFCKAITSKTNRRFAQQLLFIMHKKYCAAFVPYDQSCGGGTETESSDCKESKCGNFARNADASPPIHQQSKI